ncbi:solute carrier family 13 (sodium-dependent dicarboxylate transporter), member 2/3/5 [Desulfofundulus australicus DSM 11792]|uniref:Solute carrier family 13 (Sodium-dependent dicarboxylate transporter), member 2/3/5 n=1 Tax=Desulfofundulus australicus DSM 11792 TaxID=1121425 RepID=A0A1M5AY44_9FIRM|nr:SLC13 family permease [Desulfofundulus australicus]SHF35007.1 solute carrier family 13 (sodium-dependent dicarboxylate transporter), member 2/3/5 [Desulfofundulus australicus DSM 11792]
MAKTLEDVARRTGSQPAARPAGVPGPLELHKELKVNYRRIAFISLGLALFFLFYFLPPLPVAVDPAGKEFALSRQGQMAIGLFLLAGIWWVFEVIPIGATALAIGIFQALFGIRPADVAFRDFMDPSVLFILGSLMVGLAFTKAGLTKRLAFKMLQITGENTKMILLGVFVVTVTLTLFMAHTAVAATMFPILMAILGLYGTREGETSRFGKALFIGMAFTAGAGSAITLLGAARGIVALGFYKEITGQEISFARYTEVMALYGIAMMFLIWLLMLIWFRPEKDRIAGLKEKVKELSAGMGPLSKQEIFVGVAVAVVVALLAMQNFIPALKGLNKSAIMLTLGLLFFLTRVFTVEDLEKRIPWNIVLLFGGAMSIGFCLWQTGAAQWLAVHWLGMFKDAPWLIFVLAIFFLVMVMTNFIMNVAAIAITLPVALIIAGYLGVNPELILWTSLAAAALPFCLLVGAAPNAIAYESKQFTAGEFFVAGIPASIIALALLAVFALTIWPLLGVPALLK